jgi:hypothetical protein
LKVERLSFLPDWVAPLIKKAIGKNQTAMSLEGRPERRFFSHVLSDRALIDLYPDRRIFSLTTTELTLNAAV